MISSKISLSEDIYNASETWFTIHGLQNRNTANSITQELSEIINKYQLDNFVIATENYRLVQIKKEKDEYLKFEGRGD